MSEAERNGPCLSPVRAFFPLLLLFFCLFAFSCSSPFDGKKFEGADRAAHEVMRAIDSGAGYQLFGEALHQLSEEVSLLKRTVMPGREEELFRVYDDLLTIFRDGQILWKYKAEFVYYGFVPEGMIYVGQDIEPIVAKYGIPTEAHLFKPTRQAWRSIPDSSIVVIWKNAHSRLTIIENILKNRE